MSETSRQHPVGGHGVAQARQGHPRFAPSGFTVHGLRHWDFAAWLSRCLVGSEPFTMGAWVRMDAFGGDGGYYLMGHSTGPGNTSKWIFWLGNGGISFIIGPNGGWHGLGSFPFELDTWYHVAVRRDAAGTLAAFVDGQQIGSQAIGSLVIGNPNHALQIGTAESDRPRRPMRGTVDGVRIYKRALSDAEIETLAADEPGVLDCMAGNVDAANDRVADVLFVDGSSGGGSRRVAVESGGGFEVSLEAPPSGPDSARYAVFGWLAEPSQASSLRGGGAIVGCTVNPTPLHIGSTPQPVFCAAGDGVPPSVCGGDAPGPAYAPWNVVRMRGGSASITLQAVVQDAGASNGSGFSVTNAVIIDIR